MKAVYNTSKVEDLSDVATHNFVDRRYNRYGTSNQADQNANRPYSSQNNTKHDKKCYVCKKPGCWSTNHLLDERNRAMAKFKEEATINSKIPSNRTYSRFLMEYEGVVEEKEGELTPTQFISIGIDDSDEEATTKGTYNHHFTE